MEIGERMSKIPLEYLDAADDFGFTAVDEDEVVEPKITEVKTSSSTQLKSKLHEVEKLVMPLLVNLMKNPEKQYIHWPNRVPMIEKQIEKIIAITRSE